MHCCFATDIIPGQSGTHRQLRARVAQLLADSGLIREIYQIIVAPHKANDSVVAA